VRSRWTVFALLSAVAGCREVSATPARGPAPETTEARVPRGDVAPALDLPVEPPPTEAVRAPSVETPSPPTRVGHLEGTDRLSHLYEALAGLDDGQAHDDVRVLQYGDSHTASEVGTSVLRRLLQARFGDGGRGFVSIGKPWKTYSQDGVHNGMSSEFEPEKVRSRDSRFTGDGCYGLLGVAIETEKGGARAWADVTPSSSRVELDYWQKPGGGRFDVLVDGARAGRISTRAAQPGSGFFGLDVADGPHQIEVRTTGDGEVRVFWMTLDRAQAGVVVDSLGINGAQVFTALRWSEPHFAEQLRHRAPGLVILAYGTNEALEPHLADAEYERGLVDLLGRIARAAPSASCLLLGPPDLARKSGERHDWVTWPRVLEIVAAQRRVAQAAGCAFYDQLEAMGGPGAIAAWAAEAEPRAARDRIHLKRTGYTELATSLAADLMRGYDDWRASLGRPPTSAQKTWGVASR
jgi:lysophospholipase L1-like esterase